MLGIQRKLFFCIIIPALITACAHRIPQGWRLPTSDELQDAWRHESENNYATVEGDFNGDGIVDEAKLLLSKDGSDLGLFVFVSQRGNTSRIYQLAERKAYRFSQDIGIKPVACGSYVTACGKGYWDCEGEPPEITIKNESIDYFFRESRNAFFYWDDNSNHFKGNWMSD